MKKLKILLVFVATLCMTGCMKMNATMKINKDKSMDYEVIMAMDESLMQGSTSSSMLSDEDMKKAKENGFTISEYNEDSMKGYKITKHVKNIDSVSSTKSVKSSIDVDSDNEYLFTVKKGFFKNTYTAKLTSNSTDEVNNYMSEDDEDDDDWSLTDNEDDDDWSLTDNEDDDDWSLTDDEDDDDWSLTDDEDDDSSDYSEMLKNLDFKFEIKLPYKAISSNASEKTNGGKTLTWNLMDLNDKDIEFEFAIYNIKNIAIAGGAALAVIILVIVLIIKSKKKNSNNMSQPMGQPVQQPVEQPVQQPVQQPVEQPVQQPIQNNPTENNQN